MTNILEKDQAYSYNFGGEDVAPPADFDPNATGFNDPPVGKHLFEIIDIDVEADHDFGRSHNYVGDQLRPKFVIPEGQPYAGSTIMDFLPMPTPGRELPAKLANRWGHFIKRLGFALPDGSLIPAELKSQGLKAIMNRRCTATVVIATDQDRQPKTKADGTPQMQIKYFGYDTADAETGTFDQPAASSEPAVKSAPPSFQL